MAPRKQTAPTGWRNRIVGHDEVDPATLTANPLNARTHPSAQRAALNAVLGEIGWVTEVIANRRTGRLIDGHARVEEAITNGVPRVPVTWVDLTEAEEINILATLDPIGAMATYDTSVLADLMAGVSIQDADVAKMLQAVADAAGVDPGAKQPALVGDPDDVPEVRPDAVSKRGDVWVLASPAGMVHRVMCGDSSVPADLATLMAGDKADMVWTDPPYGVAYVGKTADALTIENDALDEEGLLALLRGSLGGMADVCRPGASWYVAAPAGPPHRLFGQVLVELGVWRQILVWVKQVFVLGHSDYHYQHEPVFYGWVPGAAHSWEGDRSQSSLLHFDRPTRSTEHPTMKPVDLVQYCIRNSSKRGAIVAEPFSGSGTTLLASEIEGRVCRAMELAPQYVDVAVRRWQTATGGTVTLEATGEAHDFRS